MALTITSCSKRAIISTRTGLEINSGNCAGCLLNAEEGLLSFLVQTDADYESLLVDCFPEHIRKEWLPPRPGPEEKLVYASLKGAGCKGCLDIVNVHETSQKVVVEIEGGFQGNCDMLIVPGVWVLIPVSDKPITIRFHEVDCADDLRSRPD
jgi:hypothetical protein